MYTEVSKWVLLTEREIAIRVRMSGSRHELLNISEHHAVIMTLLLLVKSL